MGRGVTVGAIPHRLVRVLVFSAIALFFVFVLLSLLGPPASASGGPYGSSDQPGGGVAGPAGHHGHCREEGSTDAGVLSSDPTTPSAPPRTTRETVPVDSHHSGCFLGILVGILALAAVVVLHLTGRLR